MSATLTTVCDICKTIIHVATLTHDTDLDINSYPAMVVGDDTYHNVCEKCFYEIQLTISARRNFKVDSDRDRISKDEALRTMMRGVYFARNKSIFAAIIELRRLTGIGLHAAKNICEDWRTVGNWENEGNRSVYSIQMDECLRDEVMLEYGKLGRFAAIKLLRTKTQLGLSVGKGVVDYWTKLQGNRV